jgi:SAM-dependent methyltransferase
VAGKTQQALVDEQFGPQADAYLTSAVHAAGEDLGAIAAIVRGHSGARVLDLGCGAGHVSFAVAPHVAEVIAFDLSAAMLEVVARAAGERGLHNIAIRSGTAEALPFADGEFDFVFSRFSAHHWHDFRKGLAEAARVLRSGGRAAFVDVIASERAVLDTFLQAVELLRDTSHVRDYSKAEWQDAARAAGFALGGTREHRMRLDFAAWVERMRTPEVQVQAIRALQTAVAEEVRRHFAVEPDGSFMLDVLLLELGRPPG